MPRYIDADVVIAKCKAIINDKWNEKAAPASWADAYADFVDDIENVPTADVEPAQHGRWIRGKNKSAFPAKPPAIWYCSCCGEMIRYNDSTGTYQKKKKKVNEVNPRCRRCGAKMGE